MSIEVLAEISRYYGNNPEYILAGGGNTSWKDEDTLFVKASGNSLAQASSDSFVKMDRRALSVIMEKKYPESSEQRESAVLADMMSARKEGEGLKRPSVEALLHDIIPFPFVVHLHPALINGLTCSRDGKKNAEELFGEGMIWIPSVNPGYILSGLVKNEMASYYKKHKKDASVILLQNHGVFAGAHSADGIKKLYNEMMLKIGEKIKRKPDFCNEQITASGDINKNSLHPGLHEKKKEIMELLTQIVGASAFMTSNEISNLIKNKTAFLPVSSAFTPDHIVYSGSDPLFTEAQTVQKIIQEWENHTQKTGRKAKIIAVKEIGIFSAAATVKAAELALLLFKDTVKIAAFTESFGGYLFMTQDKIDFINNWEVERFRSAAST
ncbi:MAG: class II aldolase/adducin family protein [Treponema sp.]|nr:class II aldolase/adducin family protein [Treponema sp.]